MVSFPASRQTTLQTLQGGEGGALEAQLRELRGLRFSVVAGTTAATDIAVSQITTADTIVAVVRLDRDATAANIDISELSSEASITSDGNIQLTTTNTTGDKLMVVWFDKTY